MKKLCVRKCVGGEECLKMTRQEVWTLLELREMVGSRYKEIRAADVKIRRAFRGRRVMEI